MRQVLGHRRKAPCRPFEAENVPELHYATLLVVTGAPLLLWAYCVARLWRRVHKLQRKARSLQHDLDALEKVYADAPLGLATLDRELRYLRVNKLLAQINGVSVEDHIGKTIREVVPDLAEQAEKPFLRALRSGKQVSGIVFEGTTASHPGAHRVWRESVHPVFDDSGKVTGINASVEEITEETRLNSALRASEQRERKRAMELEAVMEATPAATFIAHDPGCQSVTGNAEAVRLLRLGPNESPSLSAAGARPFTVFENGVPVPTEQLPLQVAAASGKEVKAAELSIHFPDDKVTHVLMNAAPLRDDKGIVLGAVAAFVDVTAQKQANEILRTESQRKDEFLAILAHELRNPLAAIQTGLELMKHGSTTPSQSRTRDIMARQVSHLVRLIGDLLDVSRISSGKLELKKETLQVQSLINNVVEVWRSNIEAAGHDLLIRLPSVSLYVDADCARMEQVIGNLLNNASKYTPHGGCISVFVEEDGEQVFIQVADSGIGIEREMLPKVFDMFSQTESGRQWRKGGIGLGLSIAREIVEMHGGKLTVESAGPGLGSTFRISLPLAAHFADRLPNLAEQSDSSLPHKRARILVLDNNVDAAQRLASLFESGDHIVELACSAAEAISKAMSFHPEIMFLDIGLPDMSGLDVAKSMRQHALLQRTTLVAVTGSESQKEGCESDDAGFDFYLTKPVTIEAIRRILPELNMPLRR